MTDPTNDIDALLRYLLTSGHTQHWNDDSTRWRAAITALVAERDALKDRLDALRNRVDTLRKRVAELESQDFTLPHEPFRNPDEGLRARLVCAIWPEILRQWREYKDAIDPRGDARADALIEADKMLAAMRKGDECNR